MAGGHVERLGARPSRRIGFRDVDGRSTGRAGTERRQSADRPRPSRARDRRRPRRHARLRTPRPLSARSVRLARALRPRGVARSGYLGDGRELRHAAPGVGEPDAGHGCAEMLQPALAVGAMTAVGERHDRDSVALADAGDARAGRNDVACELVPEDLRILRSGQRVRLDGRHDRSGHVLMQIGAADTARHDPDDYLPACDRRGRLGESPRCGCRAPRGIGVPASPRSSPLDCSAAARPSWTIRSARRRAKRSVKDDSESRTPRKPSRRLCPMSVNVSIVRPRSASVCHHEARVSTLVSRRP